MSLKCFAIDDGAETYHFAATSADEAKRLYAYHCEFSVGDDEVKDLEPVEVTNTDEIVCHLDEIDCETEMPVEKTVAEIMAEMKHPDVICSTAY